MFEERFYLISSRDILSKKGQYYYLNIYDADTDNCVKVFVSQSIYDYFKSFDTLTDVSHFIDFSYDNKSQLYRLTIKRKE